MKYRKKPVVIEAIQFDGKNGSLFPKWTRGEALPMMGDEGPILTVRTREGEMRAHPGDWIIKGVKGEFYPCKPDIFEATYEPVK